MEEPKHKYISRKLGTNDQPKMPHKQNIKYFASRKEHTVDWSLAEYKYDLQIKLDGGKSIIWVQESQWTTETSNISSYTFYCSGSETSEGLEFDVNYAKHTSDKSDSFAMKQSTTDHHASMKRIVFTKVNDNTWTLKNPIQESPNVEATVKRVTQNEKALQVAKL